MDRLLHMFKSNWKSITLSYSLFATNSLIFVIYPKVLGDAIDHLIAKDYTYAWYLILTFLSFMVFGYISRIYDTKVFSGIYRKFASGETIKQLDNNIDSSKLNGRLTLMRSIVYFFEHDMMVVMNTVIGLVGSIYFLSLVSLPIVGFLLITAVVIIIVTSYYSPKIARVTQMNNDLSEEQTDIVITRKISSINNLLRRGQKLSLKLSSIDAKFNVWIQGVVYGSVTALLTYYVMFNEVTVGSVFSTYRYMFDFCSSIAGLPSLVISYINIKDVFKRLDLN